MLHYCPLSADSCFYEDLYLYFIYSGLTLLRTAGSQHLAQFMYATSRSVC
uniref:Uncharacterized protein n=1 Tax=Anguilla anguilla TaxID=7936 RepID=A0A0E9WIU1_ANGAN